jgi:uncharacterized membrane protein
MQLSVSEEEDQMRTNHEKELAVSAAAQSGSNAKFIAITAIFVALTFVFTAFVNIRLPIAANGGLVHLGNIPLFIGAIIFGKKTGAIAGAVGMGLFDLMGGWSLWAPFTFVIVGLMGFVVGKITEKQEHQKFVWYAVAILAACGIKIVGYYIAEGIIYGNWIAPVTSIPGNLVQIGIAAVITLAIVGRLRKAAAVTGLIRTDD